MLTVHMLPPSPNVLRRKYRNPHVYKKLRETWENYLIVVSGSALKTAAIRAMAKSGAKILVKITIYHKKAYDKDNMAYGAVKVVLDAMVNVGFLEDDGPEHIDLFVSQKIQPGDPYTEIILEAM